MARKRIGEILIQAGVLDGISLKTALIEQRRWGGQLGKILVDMDLVSEEALVNALSQQINFPTIDLDSVDITDDVIELVSGDLAAQHRMMPFNIEGKFLEVAMSEPTNLGIIDELRIRTQLNVRPYLAGPKMIERAIERYYGQVLIDDLPYENDRPPSQPGSVRRTGPIPTFPGGRMPTNQSAATGNRYASRNRDREIHALQARISKLEALVARNEDVLRKVLGLLVDKDVATREEILDRLK